MVESVYQRPPEGRDAGQEGIQMSTYVLMKILESAPSRYDRGIQLLTPGGLDEVYDRLVSRVRKGQRVLDLGCGTGAMALRAARKGAVVKGIDINPQMLEIARKRATEAGLARNLELCEMGVAELGSEEPESYDVVMSGLCFSELSEDELDHTLKEVSRILKPGGLLLVADEARPQNVFKRVLSWLARLPLVIIVYLITWTATGAVKDLPDRVKGAGLVAESVTLNRMENFIEMIVVKPGREMK